MKNVTIYSTKTCGYCRAAKEFFDQHEVEYTNIDVGDDREKAREMIEKSGQMGVPVIVVEQDDGNEEMVIGFDQSRLATLLGIQA